MATHPIINRADLLREAGFQQVYFRDLQTLIYKTPAEVDEFLGVQWEDRGLMHATSIGAAPLSTNPEGECAFPLYLVQAVVEPSPELVR